MTEYFCVIKNPWLKVGSRMCSLERNHVGWAWHGRVHFSHLCNEAQSRLWLSQTNTAENGILLVQTIGTARAVLDCGNALAGESQRRQMNCHTGSELWSIQPSILLTVVWEIPFRARTQTWALPAGCCPHTLPAFIALLPRMPEKPSIC